ncbi:MAG TPA: hypothetical protein VFD43_13115 [Planctomycetota bacterium]|nr:hypothetical protein [Planctomycetota bacterium]
MKLTTTCLAALLLLATAPRATELIYSTGWSNYTTVESQLCGSPVLANEAADDFDLVGIVERVYVTGNNSCIAVCFPPPVTGVWVRFYEWTPTGPGALLAEHFVPEGSPGFAYDPTDIEDLDVTLPQPFLATGPTYVSVQLEFADCFYWAYWVANPNNPKGGPAYQRSSGGAWTQVSGFSMASADLSFALYGMVGPPAPPLGCGVWTQEPSPDAPGANQTWINDMESIAADDIWAVGRGYVQFTASDWNMHTFAMHFDGTQWSVVPTPNPNPVPELTYCELNAVAALAPDDVWVAGTRNDVDDGAGYVGTHNLVMHWDGSKWQQMDAPIPASFGLQGVSGDGIYDILALAPDDIWFFGEWIRMNAQGFTFRHALAMHYDGSDFFVHEDFPIVGSDGGTIYASDAAASDDIWAVGAGGDGDPAGANQSFIFHWDGSSWEHVPSGTIPGVWHDLGDVKVLGPDDVWISGSSWAPPNVVTQFMLHWDGSGHEFVQVPYAGGTIVGEPPAMYVFGGGGVSLFDGGSFTDAHLLEGLEALAGFVLRDVVQTGPCQMLAVGHKWVAGDAHTLVARLGPAAWTDLGAAKAGRGAPPEGLATGTLDANTANMVALTGAPPATVSVLVVGLSQLNAPFKGGTLVPDPTLLLPFATGDDGAVGLPFVWPAQVPASTAIYLQFWILDPAASEGFSASNALRGVSG